MEEHAVRNRVFLLVLGTAVAGIFAMVLSHLAGEPASRISPAALFSPLPASRPVPAVHRANHPYGKIELPGQVSINLGQGGEPGEPVTIVVAGSSLVSVESGTLTLRVPPIGAEPNRTEVLWAGAPADLVAQTTLCNVGTLPPGQYCFTAAFEFTPSGSDAETLGTSQSLYLDVRPEGILSSNVSFEQIRRLELRRELELRILTRVKPGLAIASEEATAAELVRLEAADPGFLDRRIAELKATDPEVARRILELSERDASAEDGSVTP